VFLEHTTNAVRIPRQCNIGNAVVQFTFHPEKSVVGSNQYWAGKGEESEGKAPIRLPINEEKLTRNLGEGLEHANEVLKGNPGTSR
jgi:hypothetical protein